MEDLPHVDEHGRRIAASADVTWAALLAVLGRATARVPAPLAAVWGLDPAAGRGDRFRPAVGDAIPGFAVVAVEPPQMLTLRGRHRFSRYELRFTLAGAAAGATLLSAHTSAAFPGSLGRVYRTLVIGSGGHVLVTRRLLEQVARRAERGVPHGHP